MTSRPELTYHRPNREQAVDYVRLDAMAFGDDPAPMLGKLDEIGWDAMRTVSVGGEVAAGLVIFDEAQRFGGRAVRSWAIGGVAVWPHHRRRGVGRALMAAMLDEARDAGVPLSVLFASTPTFYRNLGYEPAGWLNHWTVDPKCFPRLDHGADVSAVAPTDDDGRRRIAEVYAAAVRDANGPLERRSRLTWMRHLTPFVGERFAYLITLDGRDEGFVILDRERREGELWVEAVVTSRGAAGAAARLLHGLSSVVPKVGWFGGVHDPMRRLIAENAARPGRRTEEWMLRITDVEAALRQRGYPPVHAELHLEVADALLPSNAGRYVLTLRGGRATVQRGGAGRIALDVRGLAPLYTSHATPFELREIGLIDGPDEDLSALALALGGPRPFLCDAF